MRASGTRCSAESLAIAGLGQTARPGRYCGIDEAGRGPLAGPVYAAAVVLDPDAPIAGLADSKKLSAAQRELLFARVSVEALAWAIASATVAEIDRLNILGATMLAMRRAYDALPFEPELALVDGNRAPGLDCATRTLIRGDSLDPAISAASILAKVARDREMTWIHRAYPRYGFDVHKGYPTAAHLEILRREGPCIHHRLSFGPVRALVPVDAKPMGGLGAYAFTPVRLCGGKTSHDPPA